MQLNTIREHDVTKPWPLADKSVNCIVTSPPYFGQRDYGVIGQLGLEKSPEEFVSTMVSVFREGRRVLTNDGTLWIVIGDSYASRNGDKASPGVKAKDLIGIPWMFAFAMRADGWYLRQDIIWHKPNPMPESVTDRCTRGHEYIFMFSKSPIYYYDADAIKTPAKNPADDARRLRGVSADNKSLPDEMKNGLRQRTDKQRGHSRKHAGFNDRWDTMTKNEQQSLGANKRSVWSVCTKGYPGTHFATYPPDLIVDCIKAGCPAGGIVLDPFLGSGTTAEVAEQLGRNWIGFDLNPEYIEQAEQRILKGML